MKNRKISGYINYGSIPRNEYITTNTEKNINSADIFGHEPQADDTMYKQRLLRPRAQQQLGMRHIRGWVRSWKAIGWRAELASQQDEFDEFTGSGRYSQ